MTVDSTEPSRTQVQRSVRLCRCKHSGSHTLSVGRAGRAVGSGRLVGPPDRVGRPCRRVVHAGRADLPTPAGTGGECWAGQWARAVRSLARWVRVFRAGSPPGPAVSGGSCGWGGSVGAGGSAVLAGRGSRAVMAKCRRAFRESGGRFCQIGSAGSRGGGPAGVPSSGGESWGQGVP